MQYSLLAADNQGMTCVVAPLEPHDTLGVIRQPVYDLALAFVAPLGSDDYYIFNHISIAF